MLVNIIVWLVVGSLAGWIASMIMGHDAQMGCLANSVVGIVGALIGGFIMNQFGAAGATGFNLYSLMVAIWHWVSRMGKSEWQTTEPRIGRS